MAKRWKVREAAIYWVKKHRAPDAEVEYGGKLWDPGTRQRRQVDVVIRGNVGDDPVVIAVEVKDEAEPLGSQTVEQLITLHHRLETNRLVIVSWSGFVEGVDHLVEREGGWVDALTPRPLGASLLPPLILLMTDALPDGAELIVLESDGSRTLVRDVPANVNLYAAPNHGALMCMLREFIVRYLNRHGYDELHRKLGDAGEHESVTYFSLNMDGLDERIPLYAHDGTEFKRVSQIWSKGPLEVHKQQLDFDAYQLGDVTFAYTEGMFFGDDAVFVFTPTGAESGLVSWQLI